MLQDIITTLGIANPQLSLEWVDGTVLPVEESNFPLQLVNNSSDQWLAPATGFFNKAFANRLSMPDGSAPKGEVWVLGLSPQVKLRLARLYGLVIEGRTTQTDRVQRPLPTYFAYHNTTKDGDGPEEGITFVGNALKLTGGTMSIHDENGQPIDALATAAIFLALMNKFPALVHKEFIQATAPNIGTSQLNQLVETLPSTGAIRIRLTTLFKKPFKEGSNKLTNLNLVNADAGVYQLEDNTEGIEKETTNDDNEVLKLGPATFGVLGDTFTPQALSQEVPLSTLRRDFLFLYVDDMNSHVLGKEELEAPFNTDDFKVRSFHNETLALLPNGNQMTAQAGQVISSSDTLSLVVSTQIDGDFALADTPATAEWPNFPSGGNGEIPGRLQEVAMSAHFLIGPEDPRDVFLSITFPELEENTPQMAEGIAIRIFNRKFLADAREGRGNGAGGVLNDDFTVGFLLKNPFDLTTSEVIPVNPRLSFDMIAVNRTGSKRSFGLLSTAVEPGRALNATEEALTNLGTNAFNNATERSIAPAGLLGLEGPPLNEIGEINDVQTAVDVALNFGDEGQPRVAPRLPIMTRNETLVAGLNDARIWSALVSGLWLRRDSRNSFHHLGSPGSPGGEEFHGIGIHTSGGLLAYEMARMALRRTRDLADRLTELDENDNWAVPNPTPDGTFSVALLQNISPGAESPALRLIPESAFDILPDTWSDLVNDLANLFPNSITSLRRVSTRISNLANSTRGDFLYKEFRKEAFSSKYGRRESITVLQSAIKSAKDLIYIETSNFSVTAYEADGDRDLDPADQTQDLVSLIAEQMTNQPNLKVVIAVNKEVFVGKGYESFAARAYDRRKKALEILTKVDSKRVVLFHPIGYPGRPVKLMHNLVIIDDIWLFSGSGSFNRRGLAFDGNLSLACIDRQIEKGHSRAIRNLRKQLMEMHLGVTPNPGSPASDFPHPNEIRLGDLNEAFFAVKDMLDQGGSGFIEPLFDGKVTGKDPIPPESFPHRDLADPDGLSYPTLLGALLQVFIGLGEAKA